MRLLATCLYSDDEVGGLGGRAPPPYTTVALQRSQPSRARELTTRPLVNLNFWLLTCSRNRDPTKQTQRLAPHSTAVCSTDPTKLLALHLTFPTTWPGHNKNEKSTVLKAKDKVTAKSMIAVKIDKITLNLICLIIRQFSLSKSSQKHVMQRRYDQRVRFTNSSKK